MTQGSVFVMHFFCIFYRNYSMGFSLAEADIITRLLPHGLQSLLVQCSQFCLCQDQVLFIMVRSPSLTQCNYKVLMGQCRRNELLNCCVTLEEGFGQSKIPLFIHEMTVIYSCSWKSCRKKAQKFTQQHRKVQWVVFSSRLQGNAN